MCGRVAVAGSGHHRADASEITAANAKATAADGPANACVCAHRNASEVNSGIRDVLSLGGYRA